MSEEIPIVTFNLSLDQYKLKNNTHDINYDWVTIENILHKNINNTTSCIFCVQGVDTQIESKLHSFFNKANYCFITCHYDIKKIGHCIGIAFSNISYRLIHSEIIRLGDLVNIFYGINEYDIIPKRGILDYISDYMDNFRLIDSVWENCIKNNYKILGIQLKYKNGFFWVWTCDLPEEPTMNIVYALTMIREISLKIPRYYFVIAGTFNFSHDSDAYNMICGDDIRKCTINETLHIEPHPISKRNSIPVIILFRCTVVLEKKTIKNLLPIN